MNSKLRYLFDSDVLMSSDRFYYNQDYCKAFWDWIVIGHSRGIFYSLDKVKSEICKTNDNEDSLLKWASDGSLSKFFLKADESAPKWSSIAAWTQSRTPHYLNAAKMQFLDEKRADAWLVSYAMHAGNFCIVTQEVSEPQSKKIVKIPDAAKAQGITTINIFGLLKKYATNNFKFK